MYRDYIYLFNLKISIMNYLKLKITSLTCVIALLFAFTVGSMSNEAVARVPVKKISPTACYNQETGQQTGLSNNCVLGDGACEDNGCGDGQAEGGIMPE